MKFEVWTYSIFTKILFYPFYSLWIGWCFLLGAKIKIIYKDKIFIMRDDIK